jgi:hypothetical protein
VLAELGMIGFAIYVWLLVAAGWALVRVARTDKTLGVALASVLLVLFVHSLLYAGLFEDPLTWGVFGLAAAVLARGDLGEPARVVEASPDAPPLLAH